MTLLRRGKVWYIDLADSDAPNDRFKKSTGVTDRVVAKVLHDKKAVEIAVRKLGIQNLSPRKIRKIFLSDFKTIYASSRNHLRPSTLELDKYAFNSLIEILGDGVMD